MKTLLLFLLVVAPLAARDHPLTARALTIDLEMGQPHTHESEPWVTDWGSYDRRYRAQRAIQLTLRYTGDIDPEIRVEWAFVAEKLDGGLFVYDYGEGPMRLAKPAAGLQITSKFVEGSDLTLRALGQRYLTGGKPYGVIVRIWQYDAVVAYKQTSEGLLKLLDAERAMHSPRKRP